MSEIITAKTAQMAINSEEKPQKSAFQPNGAVFANGQKESSQNPWKSSTSSQTPSEKPEKEWPSITTNSKTNEEPTHLRNSMSDDKKKSKPHWMPTNIPLTYAYSNRAVASSQSNRPSGFPTRARRGPVSNRPSVPHKASNGYVRPTPRPGIPRSYSKDDTSSAGVNPSKSTDTLDQQSEQISIKSNSPPMRNDYRRNGDAESSHTRSNADVKSDPSLSISRNTVKERSFGPKSYRKNQDDNMKMSYMSTEPSLLPFTSGNLFPGTAAPVPSTVPSVGILSDHATQLLISPTALVPSAPPLTDVSINYPPIIPPVPHGTTSTLQAPSQSIAAAGQVVDLAQVISTIESIGWEKAQLTPALQAQSEVQDAQARAGFRPTEQSNSSSNAISVPMASKGKNDVIIVDSRIYFVPRGVYQTKFVKFTSKLDYINHHLGYYFSSANLTRDDHLKNILNANKDACPVEDLLQFNRLRVVNTTESELLDAASSCSAVQVCTIDGITCLKRMQKPEESARLPESAAPASEVLPVLQPLYLTTTQQTGIYDPTSGSSVDATSSPIIDQNQIAVIPLYAAGSQTSVVSATTETDSTDSTLTIATTTASQASTSTQPTTVYIPCQLVPQTSTGVPTSVSSMTQAGAINVTSASSNVPQQSGVVTQSQASSSPNGASTAMPMVPSFQGFNSLNNIITTPTMNQLGLIPQPTYHPLLSSAQPAVLSAFPGAPWLRVPHAQASLHAGSVPHMQVPQLWLQSNASHPPSVAAGAMLAPTVSGGQLYAPADQHVLLAAQRGLTPLVQHTAGHPPLISPHPIPGFVHGHLMQNQTMFAPTHPIGNHMAPPNLSLMMNPHVSATGFIFPAHQHLIQQSRFINPQMQQASANPQSPTPTPATVDTPQEGAPVPK